ncbi:hypothetical protein [Lutispora thermophila]|uniref:Uncharacterized protein n=1 Tax=Lutispora thermophila DSM 19022 TaxID=1122184 RepID=A0A1M6FKB4_9FIRM|nr:hypothetical protein [Lutispora thermophila]SHI98124.1 hypothetical protein SAMN02745176_02013 [Lutispora thermophila DSM 19022]
MKVSFTITRTKIAIITTAIILSIFGFIVSADGATPGSEQDPLVTLSFVDKKIEQIKYYIDSITQGYSGEITNFASTLAKYQEQLNQKDTEIAELKKTVEDALTFKVVQLKKGQSLIPGEGAEIIIRSGQSTALYGANGGLCDITSAKDLQEGEAIANNHMLISSRNDGRGIKAASEVYLLIKGSYTLK